jgi:hypothetical protein
MNALACKESQEELDDICLSKEDGYKRPVFGHLLMLSRHPVRVSCKSVSRPGNL